jgi:hypothetical protein
LLKGWLHQMIIRQDYNIATQEGSVQWTSAISSVAPNSCARIKLTLKCQYWISCSLRFCRSETARMEKFFSLIVCGGFYITCLI